MELRMKTKLLDAALLFNRLALGVWFVMAGCGKVFDLGMGKWMTMFKAMAPTWMPDVITTPCGYALPFIEIAVGALLVAGLFGRVVASIMMLRLISAIIGAPGLAHEQMPFHPNVFLTTLAFLLVVTGPGRLSVDQVCCKKSRTG